MATMRPTGPVAPTGSATIAGAPISAADDPVNIDSRHYRIELENDHVRVLRVRYGPYEKSVMHAHPATVAVFLRDARVRFTLPDGSVQEASAKAGTTEYRPAGRHLPENIGSEPFEVLVFELKRAASASGPGRTPTKTTEKGKAH